MNKHFINNVTEYEIANSELHCCNVCGPSILAETYYAVYGDTIFGKKAISSRFLGARCTKCRTISYIKDINWMNAKLNEKFTWFDNKGNSVYSPNY